jgi:hypothetical protein
MTSSVIPQHYEAWRHCIIVECGLKLTPSFIEKRIASLQDEDEHHTKQFIRLYGTAYHQKVLRWFMQAQTST